jgi:hypothetical protein
VIVLNLEKNRARFTLSKIRDRSEHGKIGNRFTLGKIPA